MVRFSFFICLILFAGCFSKNDPTIEQEQPQGACGNAQFSTVNAPDVFKGMCASCHTMEKDLTGPKLLGILDRVPLEEWLKAFITNQDSLIHINDTYTLEIMKWSPVNWNHTFSEIEEVDLDTLMDYITQ